MADVLVAGSLIPTTVNTPLDKRSRVATLSDVAGIEAPVLGGIFYCVADGKHYKITALKSKTISGISVANAQVDTYQQLASGSGSVNVVVSSTAPQNPADGTIWIKP